MKLLKSFGYFDQIYSISKKAARLSLLYSGSNFVAKILNNQIIKIKDIIRNNICFTDGCGYISEELAKKITKDHLQLN